MPLELISFDICPFVQRAIITLHEKRALYQLTYIDLENPPEWFSTLSPLGKVPVLKVDGEVLFESLVICEYLDESIDPPLHPSDPLQRAKHRSWIEYISNLLFEQARMVMAKTAEDYEIQQAGLGASLARLTEEKGTGQYFHDDRFTLVDAAFAPFYMRFKLLAEQYPALQEVMHLKIKEWGENLLARPSVEASVREDFNEHFLGFFKQKGSYLLSTD